MTNATNSGGSETMGERVTVAALLAQMQKNTKAVQDLVENLRPERFTGQLPSKAQDVFSALQAEGLQPDSVTVQTVTTTDFESVVPQLLFEDKRWQRRRVILKSVAANTGIIRVSSPLDSVALYDLDPGEVIQLPLANRAALHAIATVVDQSLIVWPWGIGTPARETVGP